MNTKLFRRARMASCAAILVGLTACGASPEAATGAPPNPATSTVAATTATTAPAPTADHAAAATSHPAPKPVPVLGTVWGPGQQGYGTARPGTIFNGGDPTGLVTGVHWQSWGGPVAIGTGTSVDARNSPVAEALERQATVQAFNLGYCQGKLMYRAVEWFFPSQGDKFDPHAYIDICAGEFVGSR